MSHSSTNNDLPSKICVTCGRPFTWRKKWEKSWAEVKYCSGRCRDKRAGHEPVAKATQRGFLPPKK